MQCDLEIFVDGQQISTNNIDLEPEDCLKCDNDSNQAVAGSPYDCSSMDRDMGEDDFLSTDHDVHMMDGDQSSGFDDAMTARKEAVLNRVAGSSAHFKSQQLGEPDLTFVQKKEIAASILDKKPELFLYRFGKFMVKEDLGYFDQYKEGNYEVSYYIAELEKTLDAAKNKVKIKNRRYEALQRLVKRGEYFSDSEMKKRNPLMFEQMIGQYMTDEEKEKLEQIDYADLRLTTILMDHIERDQTSSLRRKQQQEEDAMFEESEDDEEEDDDDVVVNGQFDFKKWKEKQGAMPVDQPVTDEEKQMFRDEFVHSMHQNFLMGKDEEFDYSAVDNNEDYDPWDPYQAEESYFDSEEPQNAEPEEIVNSELQKCK